MKLFYNDGTIVLGFWKVYISVTFKFNDSFRMRMFKQICCIEHYRKEVLLKEGRNLNSEDAAKEWIENFALFFPQ